jgi:hypothetical protein
LTKRAEISKAKRIYRIGVNLGDAPIEGGDIVGGGVKIPALLEGICEPAGIKYFRQRLRSRLRLCRPAFRRTDRKLDPLSPEDHH